MDMNMNMNMTLHGRGARGSLRCPGRFRHDYSRQTVLPEVGAAGQEKLRGGSVLVVGAGGLGVPVLQYLAAAGVGCIGIADGDTVEPSNLHRQPLYGTDDIGRPKAVVAAARLRALNADVQCDVYAERADATKLREWMPQYDLVIDCTDNFASKFRINDAAVGLQKARRVRQRLPVRRPVAGLPAAAGVALPALPVAGGAARRARRQLRAGGCSRPGSGNARRHAGDAGPQDPARHRARGRSRRCTCSTCSTCTGARSRRRVIPAATTEH